MTNSTLLLKEHHLPWAVFSLLLIIFAMVTPFDFSWPQTVLLRENIIDTSEAIARMEHGNMGRRAGLFLLEIFALCTLAKTTNRFRINEPIGWLLIFYLGWTLLSLTWSIDQPFTLRRIVIVYILWFAALAMAARYSLRELAALAVFVTGTTLAIAFANELRLHTFNPSNELWRFSGLFHTVAMGWNCGLLGLAAIFLITDEKNKSCKILLGFIALTSLVFLLLTKSRMAVASTLLAMGMYGFFVISGRKKLLIILGIIIFGCLGYLILGDSLLYYGEEASTLGRGDEAKESVGNLTGRIPLWTECFKFAVKRPILGYGFNSFVSPKNIEIIARDVGWIPNSIHSGYIDAIMGLGFTGAGVLIIFLILALTRALILSRQSTGYVFVSSVLVWLYYNLFLEANLITMPTFMTFFCMTLLARLAFLP